jgi:ribose transport system substrate-binding protein
MPQSLKIAVIVRGSERYWKSVHAGVVKAHNDLQDQGIDNQITWDAPLYEGNMDEYLLLIEKALQQGLNGMVLAPFNRRALSGPMEEVYQRGIPTVIIDSPLDSPHIVSLVATDNKNAGRLAATRMGELLGRGSKVLVLRYQEGSSSTEEREQGFVQQLKQVAPSLEVVVSDCCAGETRDSARRASERLLARYPDLKGIFTPNEPTTAGMLLALAGAGKNSKVTLVGFDTSTIYNDGLRSGIIQGLVVQNPFRIGEQGVKTLVDHIRGISVPERVDTGAIMVTPANMDQPEIKQLLNPPIL